MKIGNLLMAIFLLGLANTVILPILAQDEAIGMTSTSLKAPSNEYQSYPQLLALGKNVVTERSGMGSYIFLNKEHNRNVTKEVYWTSVGLHGNEWRLVASRAA